MPGTRSTPAPPRLMTCRAALNAALAAVGDQPGQGAGTGQGQPVIFCGDLNDELLAATTQIIQGPGGSEIDFRPGSASERVTTAEAAGRETSPTPAARRSQLQLHLPGARRTHRPRIRIAPARQPSQIPAVPIMAASLCPQ
jgi:hypothetical protein